MRRTQIQIPDPRRRIIDARLALALMRAGVEEFATRNTRDFLDFGFRRIWDPTRE